MVKEAINRGRRKKDNDRTDGMEREAKLLERMRDGRRKGKAQERSQERERMEICVDCPLLSG